MFTAAFVEGDNNDENGNNGHRVIRKQKIRIEIDLFKIGKIDDLP